MGKWLAVGMGCGVAIGVALHNLALGVGLGVAIAFALKGAEAARAKKHRRPEDDQASPPNLS
jgi:hypothetical protein